MPTSYPGFKTWTGTEVLTAADMNTYVRDVTDWSFEDRPRCQRISGASTQGISDTTVEDVNWAAGSVFQVGDWSIASGDSITVPVDGLYHIVGHVSWEGNDTGYRQLRIHIDGTYIDIESGDAPSSSSVRFYQNIDSYVELDAAQEIQLAVYHNAGTEIAISSTAGRSKLTAVYICEQAT